MMNVLFLLFWVRTVVNIGMAKLECHHEEGVALIVESSSEMQRCGTITSHRLADTEIMSLSAVLDELARRIASLPRTLYIVEQLEQERRNNR